MICNICGSSETYIQDGVQYCRECSEQVKGSIDEVSEDEGCIKKSIVSSPAVKKEKKDKTKPLAPWLHFEAFNLILAKQVSALIKLGCSEKLKTVVLSLWARYLQKCELAFIKPDDERGFVPRLSVFASKRDIELLYGEGLSTNLRKIKRPNFPTTSKKHKQKVAAKIPKTELPTDSDISGFEVSGSESSETSLNSPMKKKKPNVLYSSQAKKLKKKGFKRYDLRAQENCISHMTLTKTLSFCQLGLLYTEDQMLLFDLIRLVNEGAVPFIDVTRHFPVTMQLQSFDYIYFNKSAAPDIRNVSMSTSQLIHFLDLPKFKQPPLLPIAIRFVKDLNLPCDLIPVLKFLTSKIEHSDDLFVLKQKIGPIPFYEAQAMSVVLVALKMLFILDGKFEMEHSEIMTKLNAINEDLTFFVWKDWKKQMDLKEYLFSKKYTVNDNPVNRLDSLCADRINGSYPVNLIHQELATLNNQASKERISARNNLKALFEGLVNGSFFKKSLTSFPLQHELHYFMNSWKRLPLFKDTDDIDFSFIKKDFSHHKLYYRPSITTDEPTNIMLSSLYESVTLAHITDQDEYFENVLRTSKKYWYVHHTSAEFKSRKWLNDFPSSFKRLFIFMCNYLQVDKLDFYKEFKYVERKLIF